MDFLNPTGRRSRNPIHDDEELAPVMPAIDALQQLILEENKNKANREKDARRKKPNKSAPEPPTQNDTIPTQSHQNTEQNSKVQLTSLPILETTTPKSSAPKDISVFSPSIIDSEINDSTPPARRNNPLDSLLKDPKKSPDEYELVPKSVILDVYSNDPEVKRFLKQLQRIGTEFGYNEQDYKCYSCRRPIGLVFGQSRLCYYDGHHYCSECHLNEKSVIPAKILCNWDFNKYPISKRNQHFLTLISNEPMFKLKTMAPLLYKVCPELREIEELRYQAFFIRSYIFTCVQDSVSFELTKLVWPREHLIKQTDLYSIEDLIQIKNGSLKTVLKSVISFGRQHVLSCVLCCQKGFICELCRSSQIIYPFDTEVVHRCNICQSIFHKTCFKTGSGDEACPRCLRLKARHSVSGT